MYKAFLKIRWYGFPSFHSDFESDKAGVIAATAIALLVALTLHYWIYYWYNKLDDKQWMEQRFFSK
jgi:hypothetical protein